MKKMKFRIRKYEDKYHIELTGIFLYLDSKIADYLRLTYKQYIDILKLYNAYRLVNHIYYCFNTIEDAEKAVIKLESYLIMKNLVEE